MRVNPSKQSSQQLAQTERAGSAAESSEGTDKKYQQYQDCILDEMGQAKQARIEKTQQLDDKSRKSVLHYSECFDSFDRIAEEYFSGAEDRRVSARLELLKEQKELQSWCENNLNADSFIKKKCYQAIANMPLLT